MKKLHENLSNRFTWYARWHANAAQTPLHLAVLFLAILWASSFLYNTNIEFNEQAALYAAIMAQEESMTLPHLFVGKPVNMEVGPFGLAANLLSTDSEKVERGAPRMQVKLPDGKTIVINQKSFERRQLGNVHWRGTVEGRADSEVSLTLKNGFLAGVIRTGGELYEVRPHEGTDHIIEKIDPKLFPAEKDPIAPHDIKSDVQSGGSQTVDSISVTAGDVVQIDVLSVYTPQAMTAAGGAGQIDTLIQAAVDHANVAFANSQVSTRFNLVATAEAAYNDSGNSVADLNWVQTNSAVAALRQQYSADMVSLIVENGGGYCGVGYMMSTPASSFAPYAFQVTARSCAVGNLTYAHENGHNMGMAHDPANASGSSYPWSYGHYLDGVFKTVMSYNCPSGCPRVAHFSNPSVSYASYPTGIADQRDNARTANLTSSIVAGFSSSTPVTPPPTPVILPTAPTALTATLLSNLRAELSWTDNSNDETGFYIHRSLDGINYTSYTSVGANITSWYDISLVPNTTYYYRVTAYNSSGNSTFSNTASISTGVLESTPPTIAITTNQQTSRTQYTITALATDNVAVRQIQILVGGVLKKTCTPKTPTPTPPACSIVFKLGAVNNGSAVNVKAVDVSDNFAWTSGVIAK